ncbi:LPS translocon maturation chaperone LptM [Rhizomicrobium electricum]|jgi:predicted small lipoprotein YifL|uniref:Lipoprotein n=1 Tax=Rhizomicrobium electricum TaxID=480070 RepID=A0ABN1F4D5_9PROT|nr:lipoprotein [Rhizomicrobium electricum]NIJ49392.1 putative small lipoprotein YifL [Rhizomicrobium electricum]
MKLRMLIAFAAALALAGCGVKSDLEKPAASTQKAEKDPSKPPSQLGR